VVATGNAVKELIDHGYAADRAQAARLALTAGVDMEMFQLLTAPALGAGSTPAKLARIVLNTGCGAAFWRVKITKGLFDQPYTKPAILDSGCATAPRPGGPPRRCCVL